MRLEKGIRNGAVVGALAYHYYDPIWHHMWVEFLVGSFPCLKSSSLGPFSFPPSIKINTLNSNLECPLLNSHLFLLFYLIRENETCRTKSHSRAKIVKNPSTRVQTL